MPGSRLGAGNTDRTTLALDGNLLNPNFWIPTYYVLKLYFCGACLQCASNWLGVAGIFRGSTIRTWLHVSNTSAPEHLPKEHAHKNSRSVHTVMQTMRMMLLMPTMVLYRENGKEHRNYYSTVGYIGIMEKKMETAIV